MSKKSRRNRAKYQASGKKIAKEKVAPVESSKSGAESKIPVVSVSYKPSQPQAPQYQYVITELRSIGIITGAFVIILVILTFVLG